MYSQADQAMRVSQQANVNQQLRGFEQNIMGQLSQYYNSLSDFATRANNEFTEQKSFRLNEKQNLLAQQQARQSDMQFNQARGRREGARTKQLTSSAGMYGNNLLSSISRGNY
jgi:hypothetical protein